MIKYEIIISRHASEDVRHISQSYGHAGIDIAEHILSAIDSLQFFPMRYQELERLNQDDSRVIHRCPIHSFTIYYSVNEEPQQVKVYRVLHQRQLSPFT
jgi:plasmid stabilization system protein ParE